MVDKIIAFNTKLIEIGGEIISSNPQSWTYKFHALLLTYKFIFILLLGYECVEKA
ncbi:unnamed protein product [Prunus brigantina]